jgi:hypothetical protein
LAVAGVAHLLVGTLEWYRYRNFVEKGETGLFNLVPFDPLGLRNDYRRQSEVCPPPRGPLLLSPVLFRMLTPLPTLGLSSRCTACSCRCTACSCRCTACSRRCTTCSSRCTSCSACRPGSCPQPWTFKMSTVSKSVLLKLQVITHTTHPNQRAAYTGM